VKLTGQIRSALVDTTVDIESVRPTPLRFQDRQP
jgi:hypothetical protein